MVNFNQEYIRIEDLDFWELRTFCAVAKLGSISGAARALNLGQPAVTKRLKKLEEEVGMEMIHRGKRPVQLTTAGAVLLEMAGPLVEGMGARWNPSGSTWTRRVP